MILRGRFTRRRKIAGSVVLILLALLAVEYAFGMAITAGLESKDMDWNSDGQVSRNEIAQSFFAVKFTEVKQPEANGAVRTCRTFSWTGGEQIRVDCRTDFSKKP